MALSPPSRLAVLDGSTVAVDGPTVAVDGPTVAVDATLASGRSDALGVVEAAAPLADCARAKAWATWAGMSTSCRLSTSAGSSAMRIMTKLPHTSLTLSSVSVLW